MPAYTQFFVTLNGVRHWFSVLNTAKIFAAKHGLTVEYVTIK